MSSLRFLTLVLLLADSTAAQNPSTPEARIYHSAVHYNPTGELIVMGGVTTHGWTMDLQEVWAYNPIDRSWKYLDDLKSGDTYSAAYDAQSDRIITLSLSGETWAFHPPTLTWELRMPPESPSGRCGQRLTYDSESDRVVLFGGFACTSINDPLLNDTWTYDYETDTWEEMSPSINPPARIYHAQAYDRARDRTIIWGGRTQDERVWAYNDSAGEWTELQTTGGPNGIRSYQTLTFNPTDSSLVSFGGLLLDEPMSFGGELTNETWLLDPATGEWNQILASEGPSARSHLNGTYVPDAGGVLIYGGELHQPYSDSLSSDIWVFGAESKSWSRVDQNE